MRNNGDSWKVEAGYDGRVFSKEFMESVVQRFTDLLHQMCNCDPTIQVQSLLDSVQTLGDNKSSSR